MRVLFKNISFYLVTAAGIFAGLCFPFIFILIDLKQLNLPFTSTNIYEVSKGQNIYLISFFLFPVMFGIISGLFYYIFSQNKKFAKQESDIKSILNSLVDCIFVCDSTGKILYANRSFYKSYDKHSFSIPVQLGITSLEEVPNGQNMELSITNKFEETRAINYSVEKMTDKSYAYFGENLFIVSLRDVEELRKNEETIKQQTIQLYETSKLLALGEMASGFAHEINNPLAIISGKLTMIKREVSKAEMDQVSLLKHVTKCQETVVRISKLISGLQALSNSKNNEFELISISDLIRDAQTSAQMQIGGKGIDFRFDESSIINQEIVCNPAQISQVLINLFSNAIHSIEEQESPWFSLAIESNESEFKFIVTDSGSGIPMDIQKKMFEPMFTTNPIGKGVGLGLSTSRAIIETHHGNISVNNKCANTCFEVVLPRKLILKAAA
jgi:signal transduction histidine kinase